MLHQVSLEEFVRLRAVERQGRRPQKYAHISRASDEVFRQPGKHKSSRVTWGSNIIPYGLLLRSSAGQGFFQTFFPNRKSGIIHQSLFSISKYAAHAADPGYFEAIFRRRTCRRTLDVHQEKSTKRYAKGESKTHTERCQTGS